MLNTEGVIRIDALRTRYIDSRHLAVDLSIAVDGSLTVYQGHDIADTVQEKLLTGESEILDVLVHVEPDGSRTI